MKNKKGFTLVELIVAIAIMVSILVIAIVSVTNISKKQKENAYETVKQQVLTAAQDYFNANEYLFEGMEDNLKGEVAVSWLVNEGYLNVLTNPVTGKKLNECDFVSVERKDGKFLFAYSDTLGTCNTSNVISIAEVGAPSVYAEFDREPDGYNGWYKTAPKVNVVLEGSVSTLKVDENQVPFSNNNYKDEVSYKDDTKEKTTTYTAIGPTGKEAKTMITGKVDTKPPTIDLADLSSKTGIHKNVLACINLLNPCEKAKSTIEATISASDSTSGVDTSTGTFKAAISNDGENYIKNVSINSSGPQTYLAYDTAGNVSRVFKYAAIENTKDVPLELTVNVYNNTSNNVAGDLIDSIKVVDGDTAQNNIISVLGGEWLNNNNYPYGIVIECSSNKELESNNWYWNREGLNSSNVDSNSYMWNNETDGFSNGVLEKKGSLSANKMGKYVLTAEGMRRGRIYVKDKEGNTASVSIEANIDRSVSNPTINLSSTFQTTSNVTYNIGKPGDAISGLNKVQYSYDGTNWSTYTATSTTTLLNYTGIRTIHARTIDNAGNTSATVYATGYCNKDEISVAVNQYGVPFKLQFSLKNSSGTSGVTSNKYEYYYWGAESTSDNTEDADSGGRADKKTRCKNSFDSIKSNYSALITTNGIATFYPKAKKQYYCLAIRPYRQNEINGLNRWTIQGKHSQTSNNVTASNYNGVDK